MAEKNVTLRTAKRQDKMADPEYEDAAPAPMHTATQVFVPSSPSHMKIPPFWPEKPAIWFAQVEGQFAIMRITDDKTKFYHVLATLDRTYAAEVEDILTGPADYERLKSELIKRLSVSRENKVKQLLMHEQMGSRKPSQFLRHLQHLAGPAIPEDFLKTIWSSRLPAGMQPIVASQTALTLNDLAELADRVHDIATPAHQVAATSSTSAPSSSIDQLTQQIAELSKQFNALKAQVSRQPRQQERGRGSHRSRSDSRSRTRSQSNYRRFPVCWYHHKHGSKANNCVKPCDYRSGSGNHPGSQ